MSKLMAKVAIVAVTGLIGGTMGYISLIQSGDPFADCRGTTIGGGAIGGPFTLVNQDGRTVTDAEVITAPSLVYFGFTSCPDVCPLDNARNAEAVDILEDKGLAVTPVFITIDPQRDTVDVMADYVANMHPAMIGLTGSAEQVSAAAATYKAYYKKQEGDPAFYTMDHSTFTYLVLPGSGFADFFTREETAAAMAERVSCFLAKS
jgi:protein SCO1/2